ncbi:MAG: helix-turn-helix transcriptional regulator [Bdellovibrionota bacterium]
MKETDFSLGPIMKAARKFKKFNQADVANAIGCSQSALSKMEHNLLIPSAPQWFLFSRFTSIPPESLENGVIDRHIKVKFNSEDVSLGFKIPKKYRSQRSQKAREVYPFLQYIEKTQGKNALTEFQTYTGLDPEFFLDFDNLINFQLIADTMNYFIRLGKNRHETIQEIVSLGQNKLYWDHYGVEWKKLGTAKAVLTEYIADQLFFQADFQLHLEESGDRLILTYIPEQHLKQFKDADEDLVNFLNEYRKFTIEGLLKHVLGVRATVNVLSSERGTLNGRFEIRA